MKPKILVPYDFSPAAEQALCWAYELKQSLGGGSICLLYVLSPMSSIAAVATIPLAVPSEEDLGAAESALRDVVERVAPGSSVEAVLGSDVGSQVIAHADANAIGLIVMGTHGRSGVRRMVLGSVADYVVRHARCPVVTVRGPTG